MEFRYEIREATSADLDAIAAIEQAVFTDPWSNNLLRDALKDPSFVAVQDGNVLGYVFYRRIADEGEILNLAVAPQVQSRGIGTALVGQAVQAVERFGARRVLLEVRESNDRALRFYERQGFREMGRRSYYYRKPAEAALVLVRNFGGS